MPLGAYTIPRTMMEFMMRTINPGSSWKTRLVTLLEAQNDTDHRAMGFPADWKQRQPWAEANQ